MKDRVIFSKPAAFHKAGNLKSGILFTIQCNLENMPLGIRVVNLLPDPDTGWMWIQLGQGIRIQEGNGVQKKDHGEI
jgi:hypothetical protein